MQTESTLALAAAKAGMDEKTARKYRRLGRLPSEVQQPHNWSGYDDVFVEVWEHICALLEINDGLEAKTLFRYLQRLHPGRFPDGQLRTFQRRIKRWRALEGPAKEVFFSQVYKPGERAQSDFTVMNSLGITIARRPFDHIVYHFVLPFSNWETGTVCFSESFESLSEGLQNALFELGGVPQIHQTDSLTAAVRLIKDPERFTDRYRGLMRHYRMEARHTNPQSPNENGHVEQSNRRFKDALDQQLMIRGSRDFTTRAEYGLFLDDLFKELNRNRRERFLQEVAVLRVLPRMRLDAYRRLHVRVRPSSTIRVYDNTYSVHSRLIGERVEVRMFHDRLVIHYAQKAVEEMPRLRGAGKHAINYRHIIDWLVRKPGAFLNYEYRSDLFPTHRFRLAYDQIQKESSSDRAASIRYLGILELAAKESESAVDAALARMIGLEERLEASAVRESIESENRPDSPQDITITPAELEPYDALLSQSMITPAGVAA
ncbi:IS21 family transposase [Rhodothermus sp. AH-315-K08]|nr:IS21 family transposase [Rhodothermus sp. AH-315-K08]